MQKTLEGLMKSVLRQIVKRLSDSRDTQPLLDSLLESSTFKVRKGTLWSISRLEAALRAILRQNQVDIRIVFFFDALDEFDGPPDYICRFLQYLVKKPRGSLTTTKLCFSSRPWEDFVTSFGGELSLSVENFTKADIRYFCTTNLVDSLNPSHHQVIPRLADEIVIRASGVFLWANLILKEIVAAFGAEKPPTLQELLGLLRSVPNELSEYYHFIIERIPQSLRWQTYALLEAVVRARNAKELGLHYLWKTTLISDSPTYASAREVLSQIVSRGYGTTNKESERSVLLWGGGLVSMAYGLLTSDPSIPTLQLMHQTVYEFVVKLDFKDQVLGAMAKATYENGHSFHFKSLLTFRLDEELLRVHQSDMMDALRPSLDHGAEAEETTGRGCKTFLDSVPNHAVLGFGSGLVNSIMYSGGHMMPNPFAPSLIRTHAGLATYFRLRLYLRDSVAQDHGFLAREGQHASRLLRLTAACLGSKDSYAQQRLLTAHFFLVHGYAFSTEPDVLPSIFEIDLNWYWFGIWQKDSLDGLDRLAALLLEHGHHGQNQRLWCSPKNRADNDTCRPIHVALPITLTWLLEHGINVNELDSRNRTPLDYLLLRRLKSWPQYTSVRDKDIRTESLRFYYRVALILSQHGGRIKAASHSDWASAAKLFDAEGFDTKVLPRVLPLDVTASRKTHSSRCEAPASSSSHTPQQTLATPARPPQGGISSSSVLLPSSPTTSPFASEPGVSQVDSCPTEPSIDKPRPDARPRKEKSSFSRSVRRFLSKWK